MEKSINKGWTVRAIGVRFIDGQREEKPLEDFTDSERREIATRKNLEALHAAGYVPAQKKSKAAAAVAI